MSQRILTLREQAAATNHWLKLRLGTLLPNLMAREGVDMWIVIARENNEDQILYTLQPAPLLSAGAGQSWSFTADRMAALKG